MHPTPFTSKDNNLLRPVPLHLGKYRYPSTAHASVRKGKGGVVRETSKHARRKFSQGEAATRRRCTSRTHPRKEIEEPRGMSTSTGPAQEITHHWHSCKRIAGSGKGSSSRKRDAKYNDARLSRQYRLSRARSKLKTLAKTWTRHSCRDTGAQGRSSIAARWRGYA